MAITKHQYRIYIKAPIDQVWQAIVDPAFTRRYFHGTAFDTPPAAGRPYRTTTADGAPAIDGIVEVLEPPHRLVMTWHVLYDAAMGAEPPGRVEWNLAVAGDGLTQVDLSHGDLARSPLTWAHTRTGWIWILDGMKTLLETGEELPAPVDADSDAVDDPAGEWHRSQGIECNNAIWELVDEPPSPARDEELLRRAYAAAYHWQRAARRTEVNEQRALYMLAKVQLLVGRPDLSLHYASQCKALTDRLGSVDFDFASAHSTCASSVRPTACRALASASWA